MVRDWWVGAPVLMLELALGTAGGLVGPAVHPREPLASAARMRLLTVLVAHILVEVVVVLVEVAVVLVEVSIIAQ